MLDAHDVAKSNWLRYVNGARCKCWSLQRAYSFPAGFEEQNMMAFENYGNFYYILVKT